MTELDAALNRASLSENREIFLTKQIGIYKNAIDEIERRLAKPSPAILFEIDEIIRGARSHITL